MEMELSSPSANSGYEGRVCISCRCDVSDYNFLILDFDAAAAAPNSDGFIEESPILRIKDENLIYVRFCVSDVYVYVIGANGDDFISKSSKVWMSRYDLRTNLHSKSNIDIDIGPTELEKGRVTAMTYPKWKADVTASPDGRWVLVYSRIVKYTDFTSEDLIGDFELFDTKTRIWKTLPQLILSSTGSIKDDESDVWIHCCGGHLSEPYIPTFDHHFDIIAGNFISDNTFLVTLEIGLMFTLNLDPLGKGWKQYGDEHIPYLVGDYMVVVDRDPEQEPVLIVTPLEVEVVWRGNEEKEEVVLSRGFDISSEYPTRTRFEGFRVSVLKYIKNQECVSCIVRYGVDEDTEYPFLICDVFQLDLVPGNGNHCRLLGSYKYVIKQSFYNISVEGMVPFPKAIESQKRRKLAHSNSAS